MPNNIIYNWQVYTPDHSTLLYTSGHQRTYCRDVGYSKILTWMHGVFSSVNAMPGYSPHYYSVYCHFIKTHIIGLRFSGYVALSAGVNVRDTYVDGIVRELQDKFPHITIERDNTYTNDVSGLVYNGIRISGGTDVFPAWYWAGLLLRLSTQDTVGGYDSALGIISRSNNQNVDLWGHSTDKADHVDAWTLLSCGEGPSGDDVLLLRRGPVRTYDALPQLRQMLLKIDRDLQHPFASALYTTQPLTMEDLQKGIR